MAWILLIIAGMFEVVAVLGMNRMKRRLNAANILIFGTGMAVSFTCLSLAMKTLPMGTAYAIWTGIGTIGGAAIGMLFFGESRDWRRMLFMGMVLAAAVGLKLIS